MTSRYMVVIALSVLDPDQDYSVDCPTVGFQTLEEAKQYIAELADAIVKGRPVVIDLPSDDDCDTVNGSAVLINPAHIVKAAVVDCGAWACCEDSGEVE